MSPCTSGFSIVAFCASVCECSAYTVRMRVEHNWAAVMFSVEYLGLDCWHF